MLPKEGQLLRIFIGEKDRHEKMPLYEWIVRKAPKRLAGRKLGNRRQHCLRGWRRG